MKRKRSGLGQGVIEYTLILSLLTVVCMYAMINVGSIMKGIHGKVAQGAEDAKNFAQTAVSETPAPPPDGR